MSLQGQTVRIIISEPFEWNHGNLFGQILSDRGGEAIIVKLTKTIKVGKLTGDTIELRPRYVHEKLNVLEKHYSLTVNGTLLDHPKKEFIFAGTVTID
jgi:hypothetical protein